MHPSAASDNNKKRLLSKQLSMKGTTREVMWEKRQRQIQRQRSSMGRQDADDEGYTNMNATATDGEANSSTKWVHKGLTDEDLDELRGSMEIGFGFDEENSSQYLCDTVLALDLYFAVNRQLSEPNLRVSTSSLSSLSLATLSLSTL